MKWVPPNETNKPVSPNETNLRKTEPERVPSYENHNWVPPHETYTVPNGDTSTS